jgi:hypothetical protein
LPIGDSNGHAGPSPDLDLIKQVKQAQLLVPDQHFGACQYNRIGCLRTTHQGEGTSDLDIQGCAAAHADDRR